MATFTNQATLSYNNTTTTSNIVTGEIVEVLSATKTALTDTYRAGDTVTYVVSIVNSGSLSYNNLTLTDDLGEYTFVPGSLVPLTYVDGTVNYYINGVLQPAPVTTAGPPLTISGISVPAGGNTLFIYEARVNDFADTGITGTLTNTVTVTSAAGDPDTVNITAESTITSEAAVLLTITKSLSPSTIPENGRLTYTFVIQNTGNTAATITDNVTVTDTFDPALDSVVVTLNGVVLTEGAQYAYDEVSGLFQTIAGVITVPAATYTQDPVTGVWTVNPGTATLTVTGTV